MSAATKRDPNLARCAECGTMTGPGPEYHPYAFCVLVKAGLNPLTVVLDAAKELKIGGAVVSAATR